MLTKSSLLILEQRPMKLPSNLQGSGLVYMVGLAITQISHFRRSLQSLSIDITDDLPNYLHVSRRRCNAMEL